MEYCSRYSSKRFYPKSEFTSFSRESTHSAPHGASAPKKFRKDGRDIIRAKIQQGSVVLLGCSGVSDIIQHVIENGVKIAFICSNCKAIFSPRTGGYLKTHRIKCSKSIHLDKENPHQLSETETNEVTKLIVESLTHGSQSSAFFNSEDFISLLQYVHDLGFQYGLENAQCLKGATSSTFGPADISTVIPHHTELENIVRSCVNEKKNKFYELVKQSIDGNGGGFVVDTVTTKFFGFVFHFITDDWEYICAPIAVDVTKNDVIPAKIDRIVREYNLDKKHFAFVCNENGVVFPLLSKTNAPVKCAIHWMEKIFEQICENPKPSSNISAKLQTSLNDLFELVENAKTIVKYVEKDGMNSLTYNAGEFDFDDRSVSKGFIIHRFMSYSDEELEAIRSHFLTQDDKLMCKIIQILYRNKLKLGIFVKMFQPILDAIHRLEDDKSPTIHLVPGILFDYLKKLKTEKFSTQLETVLAEIISTSIEKQMDSLLSETHFYALILDPKRKNKMKDYLSKEEFLQKIKDFDKIVSEVFVESSDEKSNPASSDFNPYESTEESSTSYKTELTLYYRTNVICEEFEYDILQWWKENSIQFPTLSKLARKYLSIPSSSKSVDKIFNFTLDKKSDNENIETLSNILLYQTIEKLGI